MLTMIVNKYDTSGHLEHGPARLRDIYENFCQGPHCPVAVEHPKAAAFAFAVSGIAFTKSIHPSWWTRLLPRHTRCRIGIEAVPGAAGAGAVVSGDVGEADTSSRARQKRRAGDLWEGAASVLAPLFAEPERPAIHFDATACIQLLNALGPQPSQLRTDTLNRLQGFMAADLAVLPAAPRPAPRPAAARGRLPLSPPSELQALNSSDED